jgi:hypothetical protein
MSMPPVIPRRPPGRGLDYDALRTDALRLIQEAAGEVWTDFNEHDPGVTTLELLCYSLTELSYRAALPVADILTGADGRIDTRRQALHVPRRILPSAPVTINDYRKLLVDRVPGIGNVWFLPTHTAGSVNGLYDVLLYAPDSDGCICEGEPPDPLLARALGVYARHRALCEDVRRVTLLRPVRTIITATATIDGPDEPEEIVAELLYRAGRFLAPELRRKPITELLEAGIATSRIFEGPLLRNGFIDDSELETKIDSIDCTQLLRTMASCPGVLSLNDVAIRVGRHTYTSTDTIQVSDGEILQLTRDLDAKISPIRLIRHGSPCRPDPGRVRQELAKRWRDHRRTYPLARDYHHAFAAPHGRHRDLAHYSSIRTLYPETYGIGPRGLPEEASPLRRAQAKQLEGYLLVFEQLLADYLAQLDHARDLLSARPAPSRSYFGQSLATPDHDELIIETDDGDAPWRENDKERDHRNRVLDLLLALYAEDVPTHFSNLDYNTSGSMRGEKLNETKLELLAVLDKATRSRGQGFDYLAETSRRNLSGMELKSRIQLANNPAGHARDGTETHKLHVVEHVLLRSARHLRGTGVMHHQFEYAFTVSAVLHLPEAHANDSGLRRQAAALLRANTPAHIVVLPRFLNAERFHHFEVRYADWCAALRSRNPRDIVMSSVRLRDFLAHSPPEPMGEMDVTNSDGGISL